MKGKAMHEAIKQAIIEYLFNEKMKKDIVEALNEHIDIPFISEKTEGKILDAVYSSVEKVLKDAINKG